jgi:hypothetical protein
MALYPKILLPRKFYPRLPNEDLAGNSLVRETVIDLYPILNKRGYAPDDVVRFIVAPQPSLREIFELSVFLYGYYDERHTGIHVPDSALYDDWTPEQPELLADDIPFSQEAVYPLFLSADRLSKQELDFNGENHLLSFSHRPTRINYWHFELWAEDSKGTRIPRDKSNTHTKYLAKSILEYIASEAILQKNEVRRFRGEQFEGLESPELLSTGI